MIDANQYRASDRMLLEHERNRLPLYRFNHTIAITTRTLPTRIARPAYICQRLLDVKLSAANTGPKPQRSGMKRSCP